MTTKTSRKGHFDLSRFKENQIPKGLNVRKPKDSENTRTRIEKVPEEQIPEWRRTVLWVRA